MFSTVVGALCKVANDTTCYLPYAVSWLSSRSANDFSRKGMRLTTSYIPLRTRCALFVRPSLRESSEGLLSSFCSTSSPVSTSLRAARADRRFANYSLSAGKPGVEPSTAAATTLLEAANAWSTPSGQPSASTYVGARLRGDQTPRGPLAKIQRTPVGRGSGYHMREGCERAEKRSTRWGESAGDRNRESHAELHCRRNGTTSVGGAMRFVGRLAI